MIETEVESIRVQMNNQNRVVFLKEVAGTRHLPIWIGEFEAHAIAIEMQGVDSPRPLPYDLLETAIRELGGTVQRIQIVDLSQDVYFARIIVVEKDRVFEIDARPSDAIALAVRTKVPIMVEETVMDKAGVSLESEPEGPGERLQDPRPAERSAASTPEEEERLAVFRDFVNALENDEPDSGSDN